MPPPSDDPRRDDPSSRRASARTGGPARDRRPGSDDGQLGGMSSARAYTPRGRTVRETAEQRRTPRTSRSGDPFRPALQVLDGGRGGARAAAARTASARSAPAAATRDAARTVPPRTGRGGDVAKPVPAPRRRPNAPPRRGPARRPRPPRLADPRRRLRLGTLLVLTLFAVIGIRLVAIQVMETPAYAGNGLANRLRTVDLPAPRGAIYDRSGVPLAHSVEARFISADPTLVSDPKDTAEKLRPLLGIPATDLIPRLTRQKTASGRDVQFQYLARGVPVETAEKIMDLNLAGVYAGRDERREVPGGDLAANLLGFVGWDMNGLEGLEARYDEVLRGQPGQRIYEVGNGRLDAEIPGGHHRETPAKPGGSLTLTIDRDLQYITQGILSERAAETDSSVAAAVVMDVKTGEVLAQASHPTYDAAKPTDSEPGDREDAATGWVVDPGSVHKPITVGAALQEGTIRPDDTVTIPPVIVKGDQPYRDTHPVPAGVPMTLPGIMAYSSNVGIIKIADELGKEKLYEYQRKFGLGEATGVGVAGEAGGQLLPPDQWSGSAYGSVPIGMSVSATPLQMAAAFAAIANDGTWVQPRLIKETIRPDGTREPAAAPTTRPVLSPENAAALRTMMEAVTEVEDATGTLAAIPGYRVAGKTGTGKRVENGHYAPGEVASFIGMAPADNPRFVVAVFAYAPQGGGGDISAPAFKEIMQYTLGHYRVPPTGTKPPNFVVYPR
ncbi:peptidoglycan D,D-transpeptidase FtsI family protein [Plantactinospora sp. GCM10030261]|uniref:peptidoglycan D,D-transpeptidase FtsI family protein n=1 Tax=Plantactinospora sp. GCM10030261 TaxID=3273420 RepID=UPI00360F18F9